MTLSYINKLASIVLSLTMIGLSFAPATSAFAQQSDGTPAAAATEAPKGADKKADVPVSDPVNGSADTSAEDTDEAASSEDLGEAEVLGASTANQSVSAAKVDKPE